ncbi:MAG TPA: cytochrome c [Chitinophagaceae bacterium]
MKKFLIIAGFVATGIVMVGCDKTRRSPGRAYMPDMAYSTALETYAYRDTSKFTTVKDDKNSHKIFYNNMPVEGTIARGDIGAYTGSKTDTTGMYAASASIKNPLDPASIDMKEAQRLYLVNCGICHGAKLDGNGPLYKGGDGPYPAKPATLVGDAKYEAMAEGTMFHSVTYGLNAMGSYASQLSTTQRWMVVAYIKSKQVKTATATAAADSNVTVKPVVDTVKKG